jgi:hypothetical protein
VRQLCRAALTRPRHEETVPFLGTRVGRMVDLPGIENGTRKEVGVSTKFGAEDQGDNCDPAACGENPPDLISRIYTCTDTLLKWARGWLSADGVFQAGSPRTAFWCGSCGWPSALGCKHQRDGNLDGRKFLFSNCFSVGLMFAGRLSGPGWKVGVGLLRHNFIQARGRLASLSVHGP